MSDLAFDWRLDHADFGDGAHYCLEVRPKAGTWKPFLAGVPADERAKILAVLPGTPGMPPDRALVANPVSAPSPDGTHFCWQVGNAATPEQSYFIYMSDPPAIVIFGQAETGPQFQLDVRDIVGAGPKA